MKHFIQFNQKGTIVDAFYLAEGPNDQEKPLNREHPLYDYDAKFSEMKVNEEFSFSGTTTIKRIA